MSVKLQAKPSDLAKAWSLARSSDLRQMTVRVPSETFIKIQVLEAMFPQRSRNEMVSDLLATALDEFVESLPFEIHQGEFLGRNGETGEDFYAECETGPRMRFFELLQFYRSELAKPDDKADLKVVSQQQEQSDPKEAA